jgi:hypothetical protein
MGPAQKSECRRKARKPTSKRAIAFGQSHRIFTPDEKKNISTQGREELVSWEYYLQIRNSDESFSRDTRRNMEATRSPRNFTRHLDTSRISTGQKFFVLSHAPLEESNIAPGEDQTLERLNERAVRTRRRVHIFNAGETCGRPYPNGILAWQAKGQDSVDLNCTRNEKACITVMARISAAGDKWPLFFVTKGKTVPAERSQIGDIGPHDVTLSESGWMTVVTFKQYLILLRHNSCSTFTPRMGAGNPRTPPKSSASNSPSFPRVRPICSNLSIALCSAR